MTERKTKKKESVLGNANPQPAAEKAPQEADRLAALEKQLTEAQALAADSQQKSQEYLDALMRERADFTNFRRRMEQERAQLWGQASAEMIKKLLPVLDDLERALQNRPAEDMWANGVELIARKFISLLEKEGVTPMQAKGQPFDPNLHEAILQEPCEDCEPGTVIEVLQQGYLHGEKALRPALVKVAQ